MVRIISDSTCDLSAEEAAALGVTRVPLKVNMDGKQYVDGFDITPAQFFELLGNAKTLPTTSQPSPEEFLAHFEEVKAAGDSAIVLTIAASLSGTYQSACIAKEMADYEEIYIIDSFTTTVGLRLLLTIALEMAAAGKTAKEIAEHMEEIKGRVHVIAILDTLEYLHKGGRLSRSKSVIGTLLNVKPIIDVNKGGIEVPATGRGAEKSVNSLVKLIEAGNPDPRYGVLWGYTSSLEAITPYRSRLPEQYQQNFVAHPIGSVIGTHIGPGAMAAVFLSK